MSCGDEVVFARRDYYVPSRAEALRLEIGPEDDFPEGFDIGAHGNNRLDEVLDAMFSGQLDGFVVWDVRVSAIGDLSILFENGFLFEARVDHSVGADEDLVMTAEGLEA